MQIHTVDNSPEFARLKQEWDEVLSASSQDSPFVAHQWLSAWWDAFGCGDELAVLTCREGGRLVGALPLYMKPAGGLVQTRALRYLADTGVGSAPLTALALPDVEDAVLDSFVDHFRAERRSWDVLDLRLMDAEDPFFRRLSGTCKPGAVRIDVDWHVCPRIALPGDYEAYLGTLTADMRGDVRRRRRRLAELGAAYETATDTATLPRAIDDLVRMHEGRMRHKGDSDFVVTDASRAFMANTMEWMLSEGRLRLWFLTLEGRRVAFTWQFRYRDTMHYMMTAFDEAYSRQDVGRALLSRSIENAIEEGCTVFDMMLGAPPYKLRWAPTQMRYLSDLHVYAGSLAGGLRRGEDAAVACARRAVESGPERLREPLKRFARSARASLRG